MIILGIDPGTRVTGYALLRTDGRVLEPIDYGCIRPPPQLALPERYKILFEALERLIALHAPQSAAVESQYIRHNPQSAMKIGMAKAMALLACARAGIPIAEYPPTVAKRAVVGNGGASKEQIGRMLQSLLHLPQLPQPEDASDALAMAICHAHNTRNPCTNLSKERSWPKSRSGRWSKRAGSPTGFPSV